MYEIITDNYESIISGAIAGLSVAIILGSAHGIRFLWRKWRQKKFLRRTIKSCNERIQDKHWSNQLEIFCFMLHTIRSEVNYLSIDQQYAIIETVIYAEDRMEKWRKSRERGALIDEAMAIDITFGELEQLKWLKLHKENLVWKKRS